MKKSIFLIPLILFNFIAFSQEQLIATNQAKRGSIIEDFDSGNINLESWGTEDLQPNAWEFNSQITWNASPFSLKLYGNTWKFQQIMPRILDTATVWQVSAYLASTAEFQGFGLADSANVLFYSFAGTQKVSLSVWEPVYQGCFPASQWNAYQLPVGNDWLARFGYLPQIAGLVYINNRDNTSQGVIYFDQIADITEDLPVAPKVSASYAVINRNHIKNKRSITIQFTAVVNDPGSNTHNFFWDFGDGNTSTLKNPLHSFILTDDHAYTVLLKVMDETNYWGYASCRVPVPQGSTSLPVSLNFVGDIMLARNYETSGGIIPTQGVEAIFAPTRPYLGLAADITVANLECPLTTHWQNHPTKTIYFKGSPANVAGLAYAGIDVVSLANNHILDYLQPGLVQTCNVLNQNNILHSGAGINACDANQPAFISKSGLSFAFLASSNRTGQYNNYQPYLNAGFNKPGFANLTSWQVRQQINEVKDVVDLVILEWHAGTEYSTAPADNSSWLTRKDQNFDEDEDYFPMLPAPTRGDIELRREAIDNGADLVICHHPHIVHGVEVYKGKLIAHSLGNFAFDLTYPETFPSMILNSKADLSGFYDFNVTPVYIDDFIPRRAFGALGLYILDHLAWLSRDMNTCMKVDRENITAQVIIDTLSINTIDHKLVFTRPQKESPGLWQSPPLTIERSGSISSAKCYEPNCGFQFRVGRELVWFGNMEDEGCTLWNLNSSDENYCDTVSYEGARSIQLRRSASATGNIITNFEQRIICPSTTDSYSLYGYIRTQNAANVTIEVQYFQNRTGGNPIATENIGLIVNGSTPWTFYHRQLSVPAGANYLDIRLNSGRPASGTSYAWFDKVGLIRWEDWNKYALNEAISVPNNYYFIQIRAGFDLDKIVLHYQETVFNEAVAKPNTEQGHRISDARNLRCTPNILGTNLGNMQISFELDETSFVNLAVFDIQGRLLEVLCNTQLPEGIHQLHWDGKVPGGRSVRPGIYFLRLETRHSVQTMKVLRF